MDINKFKNETIVTAKRGTFLKLKENAESEAIIGRPERIIFSNSVEIPEFEEENIVKE